MNGLSRGVADDIHMDGFRLCIPDIETHAELFLIGTDALRDIDLIGAALFHRLWQLEEEPVVEFAG